MQKSTRSATYSEEEGRIQTSKYKVSMHGVSCASRTWSVVDTLIWDSYPEEGVEVMKPGKGFHSR